VDRSSFAALVSRLDEFARRSPASYQLRVVLLGLLGYGYIFLAVAIIATVVAGVVYMVTVANPSLGLQLLVKLALPLALVGFAVLRALNVSFPVPDGLPINRTEAPRLFALLDELASSLDAPPSDAVLATPDFNASVVEVPRLGIFGWSRHYLLLGLPLLSALTPAQVRAVLAHELGHQSRRHGRVGAWIYRIRTTWTQILNRLHKRGRSALLFTKFFEWYSPYFAAYSFVLARQHEYEADRRAAELTSPADLGEALINLDTKHRYLDSILWPRVGRLVAERDQPPESVHTGLARRIAAPLPATHAGRYLTGAMGEDTGLLDTHPALRDRLAAIHYAPPKELKPTRDASPEWNGLTELFGADVAARLLGVYDARWRASVAEKWKKGHADSQKRRKRLDELASRVEAGTATSHEAREHAFLVDDIDGWEAAAPHYAKYLAANQGDLEVRLAYGRALLWQQDAAGIPQLEAASANPSLGAVAHQLMAAFLRDHGDVDGARRQLMKAEACAELVSLANAERAGVTRKDTFESHGMAADAVRQIREVLAGEPAVKRAYAIRKTVEHLPEQSMYVIVVDARFTYGTQAKSRALAKRLAETLPLPGRGLIVIAGSTNRWLMRRAKKTADSLVYTRERKRLIGRSAL
jgi:Zn-dependent protease with chaperone function